MKKIARIVWSVIVILVIVVSIIGSGLDALIMKKPEKDCIIPTVDTNQPKERQYPIGSMSEIVSIMKDIPDHKLHFNLNGYFYMVHYYDSKNMFDIMRVEMVNKEPTYINSWEIEDENLVSWIWNVKNVGLYSTYSYVTSEKRYFLSDNDKENIDSTANQIKIIQTELNEYIKNNFR